MKYLTRVSSIPVKVFKKETFIYETTIGGYILNKFSRLVFVPLEDIVFLEPGTL